MKRNALTYALPLACLLAAGGVATRTAIAADDSYGQQQRSATPSDTQSADPSRSGSMSSDSSTSNKSSMADAAITAKVKSALLAERDIPSTQIKVETNDGVVQLSGFLNSQDQIDKAVSVARDVKDVKSVENNMQTK